MASAVLLDLPLQLLPLHPASIAILFSVLLCTILLIRFQPSRTSTKELKLPPSPPKLPFIGNLHQLGPIPHQSLRDLSREHGPLLFLQLGQVPTLIVSSAEAAEGVLKAHDLAFANRPRTTVTAALAGDRTIGFAPYGEHWRQVRKTSAIHLLSSYRVQAFRPAREEEVARLVGKVSELSSAGGAVDMSKTLSLFATSLICRAAVGRTAIEEGKTEDIPDIIARTAALVGFLRVENFFPTLSWLGKLTGLDAKLAEVVRRRHDFFHKIASGRKLGTAEEGGFLNVLLSLQADHSSMGFVPSGVDTEAILLGLIGAGGDTSYLVLERTLEELVKNPGAMKKAQEEVRRAIQGNPTVTDEDVSRMSYLKAVIKESLRLHPPAPLLLPRESVKAVQMQGYEIPTNTKVIINAWAIGRDPNYWDLPEEFRPERFLDSSVDFRGNDFQFIPFGGGRRICPGMHFAVATIELALANLLYHFNWSLPEGMNAENLDGGEVPGLTVHRRRGLVLVAKPG